jgi:BlaI family penicillinase repressor
MARPASKHPTKLELEILKVLWKDGPATVRAVRDSLAGTRDLAYTSVMTVMNIMTQKGFLKRVKDGQSFVYSPRVSERETTRRMLGDLVDRLFDGSAAAAMLNLLETSDIDEEELKRLRALLNEKTR